jgi:very-short-patch-repair endonuclease
MVVAEGEKVVAMTQRDWQRRFNVAATRAEDQLWLFHSISLSSLKPQDLRKSLLEYVMSPPQVFGGIEHRDLHWDSEKRAPFGSKFEQRVFLRIRNRGYFLQPQVEVNGRFIDLVVSGAKGRLAVECDGDFWHSSPDDQLADIDRQVELERAGWRFVRIRESAFNRNPDGALLPLWNELERRGIYPGDLAALEIETVSDWQPIQVVSEEGLDGIEDSIGRDIHERPDYPKHLESKMEVQSIENGGSEYLHPFRSAPNFDRYDWEEILNRTPISDFGRDVIDMRLGLGRHAGRPQSAQQVAHKLNISLEDVQAVETRVEAQLVGPEFDEEAE